MGGFRVQGLGFWGLFMVSGSVFVWGSGCISGLGSEVFLVRRLTPNLGFEILEHASLRNLSVTSRDEG